MAFSKNDEEIRDTLIACGIPCGNSSSIVDKYKKQARSQGATEHASILEKLKELYPPKLVTEPTTYVPETAVDTAQPDSRSIAEQITATSMIKGVETMRFTLRLSEGKTGRKDIFIEKPFSDALDVIIPDEMARKDWLVDHVRLAPEQNPASAIRCAIVTELLKYAPQKVQA